VLGRLLEAQGDSLGGRIDLQDGHDDLLAGGQQLLGVDEFARPAQVGDVNQAFDALLQLDESAEVGQADDVSGDFLAGLVLLLDADPGIGEHLLVAQGDSLVLFVEVQDDDVDFLVDLEQLRGMGRLAPTHVGNVEEPLDPADVHEGAEVGQALDVSLDLLSLDQVAEDTPSLLLAFVLQIEPPGNDGVFALPVELHDLELAALSDQGIRVLDGLDVRVGFGQKGFDPHVHRVSALGPGQDDAGDPAVVCEGLFQVVQCPHCVGPLLGEDDVAVFLVGPFQGRFDFGPRLQLGDFRLPEILDGDDPFGLESDVHEDVGRGSLDDLPLDDASLGEFLGAELVAIQ